MKAPSEEEVGRVAELEAVTRAPPPADKDLPFEHAFKVKAANEISMIDMVILYTYYNPLLLIHRTI